MNFSDRIKQEARAYDLSSEKRVTVKEFDEAVDRARDKMLTDDRITGAAALLMPLIGMIFSDYVKDELFNKED